MSILTSHTLLMTSMHNYDVRLMYPPRNHCMVTSLLLHSHFSSFFEKPLISTENAIGGQIFNQFLLFQNAVLFPVMTELSAKTAFQKLFSLRRSSGTKKCNLKSDPILLITSHMNTHHLKSMRNLQIWCF